MCIVWLFFYLSRGLPRQQHIADTVDLCRESMWFQFGLIIFIKDEGAKTAVNNPILPMAANLAYLSTNLPRITDQ